VERVPALGLKGHALLKIRVEMISFKTRFPDLSKAKTGYAKTGNTPLLSNEEYIRKHKKFYCVKYPSFFGIMLLSFSMWLCTEKYCYSN